MTKYLSFLFILLTFMLIYEVSAQNSQEENFSGAWKYEVRNTPYGNFFGTINLRKVNNKYIGNIINSKGIEYKIDVLRIKENTIVFASNIEETNSIISCRVNGDSLNATAEVKGDNFLYKLKAKRGTIISKKIRQKVVSPKNKNGNRN